MAVNKGEWVQICNVILNPGERAPHLPDDTKNVPLKMWAKGYLIHSAEIGEFVEIETVTGRRIKGMLEEVNPGYIHTFGKYIPELSQVRDQVKSLILGGEENE
ncbi:2-amino-4-oxopentanoate thiolase subunit OrtA [Petroclostridium sp. X23]|uniref:2-amino-4-oxopentanoate thiolase subunit OrtA n=1 Tax=Petroclostridium sp. X23 TaxID=3045146 RepID=UPI0024AE336D|nr:2-amino-4-oxopentanoate thiolase subunit OrtA [Petroclostridium sp. X23]WHH61245.1 2-amino-4-oxopentanoate thiolase subunit OrtA [Petroclostridium sp. X23]